MAKIDNFWKNQLSLSNRKHYDAMLAAFVAQKECFECGSLPIDYISDIYCNIQDDHPELFYLPCKVEINQLVSAFSKSNSLKIKNLYDKTEIARRSSRIRAICETLRTQTQGKTDIEIECAICDYLTENTVYKRDENYNQNASSALIDKAAQCSGIAHATKLLCDCCGLECIVVRGDGKNDNGKIEPHMWNIVKINGQYTHLDVTFMIGSNRGKVKPYRYAWVNYSDEEVADDRVWDRSVMPRCVSIPCESVSYESIPCEKQIEEAFDGISVSSMFEFKRVLKRAIKNNENGVCCEILLQCDVQKLMALVQESCEDVSMELSVYLEIEIAIEGKRVTLAW